jgi:hypothetical protein
MLDYVPEFLPNHDRCLGQCDKEYQPLIERFAEAHSYTGPISRVFQERIEPNKALNWPFVFDEATGEFEMDGLEEEYWKMVVKQPGKARHGGFHLAVMARFGTKWAQLMYDVIKASLVMRYTPDRFRAGMRIPIPKPTPGETRPLTLLHDAYCFISSSVG